MRTDIPVQAIGFLSALNPVSTTAGDAANNHSFVNDGKTLLYMANGEAALKTATIVSVADPYGRTGDLTMAVVFNDFAIAGPFIPTVFNQAGGLVNVDLDVDTSVTFAAVSFDTRKSL